jgi:hypothetical protein
MSHLSDCRKACLRHSASGRGLRTGKVVSERITNTKSIHYDFSWKCVFIIFINLITTKPIIQEVIKAW